MKSKLERQSLEKKDRRQHRVRSPATEVFTIKKVTLLIPCYNEEQGIANVINKVPQERLLELGYETDILVIDNNSTDRTAEIARSLGVRVISEKQQGKGAAMITAFRNLPHDADYIAMIDGDDTYDPKELPRLLEPIDSNFADVIIGTRLNGKMDRKSMKGFNRIGNWLFTFLARIGYRTNTTDVCSGFFAWKKDVLDELTPHLASRSFSIEMEMIVKMARLNFNVFSVPISYNDREGNTNLRPIKDGVIILAEWFKNLTWKPNTYAGKSSVLTDKELQEA
ncbi:MAG: glycosyltransferase [DPANN group archaeon]|nr:glycosyltransferase [DPANN group archaeon]